jgi:hypothetical protein
MDIRAQIIEQFTPVAKAQVGTPPQLTDDLPFPVCCRHSSGLAILVARLEDLKGVDLFSSEEILFPATFGEFASCYDACAK